MNKFTVGISVLLVVIVLGAFIARGWSSGPSGPDLGPVLERDPVLLDVRTAREFSAGHLGDARNIPHDQVVQQPGLLGPKDRPILVYCQSGGRSRAAAGALEAAGYEVIDLGGIGRARALLDDAP